MNKELVLILYALRSDAIQYNLCRVIGLLNTPGAICINKLDCLNCILHKTPNSKFYPNKIAITSLVLFKEDTHEQGTDRDTNKPE